MNSETEQLDLMRDEFRRIKGRTNDTEIRNICDRAVSNICQHTPVIAQRDEWEAKARELASMCWDYREDLSRIRDYVTSNLVAHRKDELIKQTATDSLGSHADPKLP